ncbi:uncharacterized protein BDZ99DRAFT_70008 [Mytilinidion resinicola]|uniref:Uncharacterized protein n=1 Tax=Mytilinidion resinicola TaxID=574789 RepID=A0A6A6YGM7_9PEZI|nr:uncharacterized protein BDZ99DRAFT_70008 [Mytilinidion resinicola]KAF2807966.1 hypothetical protein BDZ99DRAFT_70008 [Mytilinidion resinicola]
MTRVVDNLDPTRMGEGMRRSNRRRSNSSIRCDLHRNRAFAMESFLEVELRAGLKAGSRVSGCLFLPRRGAIVISGSILAHVEFAGRFHGHRPISRGPTVRDALSHEAMTTTSAVIDGIRTVITSFLALRLLHLSNETIIVLAI